MTAAKRQRSKGFVGTWHIYEMGQWDEEYFNMETQAYIQIDHRNLGQFQFGLVVGDIDGEIVEYPDGARFEFTWDGTDEMDPVHGSGWLKIVDRDTVEGEIRLHLGDRSKFRARKAG